MDQIVLRNETTLCIDPSRHPRTLVDEQKLCLQPTSTGHAGYMQHADVRACMSQRNSCSYSPMLQEDPQIWGVFIVQQSALSVASEKFQD